MSLAAHSNDEVELNKRPDYRLERDQYGELSVPFAAYWGIQTGRAREVLTISGLRPHARLVESSVLIKKAAAAVNQELGLLDTTISRAIIQAADEVLNGQWRDQFIVDPFQPGGGWVHNVNVNEVLANRAAEILGGRPGEYTLVHPQHVNLSQSTNDVFPTATRIAILLKWRELEHLLLDLERLLRRKALEFDKVVKVGRVHLRDSLPVTLGQEFNAYGSSIERACRRFREASQTLLELNAGGTFVGSGAGADPSFFLKVAERLGQATGLRLRCGDDLFRLSQSSTDYLQFSSALKELAADLIKIANDLRLLSSGPETGLGEISLPAVLTEPHAVAPKLLPPNNPAGLAETLVMVAFQVIGNDQVICLSSQAAQLESSTFTPLISFNILQSMNLLKNCLTSFNQHCVSGITANKARCEQLLDASEALLLSLAGYLGMERARTLRQEALAAGRPFKEYVLEQNILPPEQLKQVFLYKHLTLPGARLDTEAGGTR